MRLSVREYNGRQYNNVDDYRKAQSQTGGLNQEATNGSGYEGQPRGQRGETAFGGPFWGGGSGQ